MFPLYDESVPRTKKPFLVLGLILINVLIFLFTYLICDFEQTVFNFGLVPEEILQGKSFFTFLSSMFLHAGILHLVGNMWFLWVFGDNLEHNLGFLRFLFLYIFTGIAASLVHIFTVSTTDVWLPVIGASGAISGVLGGYVILFPRNKIKALMMGYFRPYFISIPARSYALIWFIYQLIYAGSPGSIAYMAHIGGFLAGIILALPLRRKLETKDFYQV